jgi:hypothetical protein
LFVVVLFSTSARSSSHVRWGWPRKPCTKTMLHRVSYIQPCQNWVPHT